MKCWSEPNESKSYPGWSPRPKTGMGQTDLGRGQGVQTEQTRLQVWARQNWPWSPWARPNSPKANTGPDRTDQHCTRPKRLSTWARWNRPKTNPGPDRTDPRPTLGQTEKTQYLGQTEQTQELGQRYIFILHYPFAIIYSFHKNWCLHYLVHLRKNQLWKYCQRKQNPTVDNKFYVVYHLVYFFLTQWTSLDSFP